MTISLYNCGRMQSWEEKDWKVERLETDREEGREEELKKVVEEEKKRGVVSPCVQAGAAH